MAGRNFSFYMTVDETWEALRLLAERHHLRVYIQALRDKMAPEWTPTEPPRRDLTFPLQVYLAEETQPIDPATLPRIQMGKVGALILAFDGIHGNRLYMNDLSARSDWVEDDHSHERPAVLVLHRKCKATLKKQLTRGVIATNIRYGGSSPFNDVWLSPGAIRHHQAGGELMQYGVENVRMAPLLTDKPA